MIRSRITSHLCVAVSPGSVPRCLCGKPRVGGVGIFSAELRDFAALGEGGDAVGGAEGQGFDGHGGARRIEIPGSAETISLARRRRPGAQPRAGSGKPRA